MKKFLSFTIFLLIGSPSSFALAYEETMSDMLIQCNAYQSEIFADNRTVHQCEKDNYNEDYSYVITPMETRYSKQKFLCFLFLKDDFFKLKFKFWFSHRNYAVDAVSDNDRMMTEPESYRIILVWCEGSAAVCRQVGVANHVPDNNLHRCAQPRSTDSSDIRHGAEWRR